MNQIAGKNLQADTTMVHPDTTMVHQSLKGIEVVNIPQWTAKDILDGVSISTQEILSQKDFKNLAYRELREELYEIAWIDLDALQTQEDPPFEMEKSEYNTKILGILLIINEVIHRTKHGQNTWRTTNNFIRNFLKKYQIQNYQKLQELCKIICSKCIWYQPALFKSVYNLDTKFWPLMQESDKVLSYFSSIDPRYQQAENNPNCNPNTNGIIWDFIANMQANQESIIHTYSDEETTRALKISILWDCIIRYLLKNKWETSNSDKWKQDTSLVVCFIYLSELIQQDNSKNQRNTYSLLSQRIFWDEISKTKIWILQSSQLYKFLEKENPFSPQVHRFICKVALLHPNIFLSADDFCYKVFFRYISSITNLDRQNSIIHALSRIHSIENWSDLHLTIIILLHLEHLSYIWNLTKDDIDFIQKSFCIKTENNGIKRIHDSSVLHSIDYDIFCLMRAISENPNWWDVVNCILFEQEKFPQAGTNMLLLGELKLQVMYIPECYSSIHDAASQLLDLQYESYKFKTSELRDKIQLIKQWDEFTQMYNLHRDIIHRYYPGKVWEWMKKINYIYTACRIYSFKEKISFIKQINTLPCVEFDRLCESCRGQELASEIIDFDLKTLQKFMDFIDNHDLYDDLETAVELFFDSQLNTVQNSRKDINTQMIELFWESIGRGIISIWFKDEVRKEILNYWYNVPTAELTSLWIFLKENKKELHNLNNKDSSRFMRKIRQISQVIHWMRSISIYTIKKPEKLYQHIFFTNNTENRIQRIVEIFDENDIDSQQDYDTIVWEIIKFLRDGNEDNLLLSLWLISSIVENEVIQVDSKLKQSKGFTDSKQATKYPEKLMKIQAVLNSKDPELWALYTSILSDTHKRYDKEIYAVLIINWHSIEWEKDEMILEKLIGMMKSEAGQVSLDSMGKLLKWISLSYYSPNQVWDIFKVIIEMIWNNVFQLNQYTFAKFINRITFLSNYDESGEILSAFVRRNEIRSLTFTSTKMLHITLYGLYDYREKKCVQQIIKKLLQQVKMTLPEKKEWIIWYIQILNLYWIGVPKQLMGKFYQIQSTSQIPNNFEECVANEFWREFDNIVVREYIDWFESDIVFMYLWRYINIEVDGIKYHSGIKALKDKRRTQYMENRNTPTEVYRVIARSDWKEQVRLIISRIKNTNS